MSYFVLLLIIYVLALGDYLPCLGKGELIFSAINYLLLCCFCLEWSPLGALDRLHYFIAVLPGPAI